MAWTSKVDLYKDRDDVGIVTVVWNAGMADEQTFSLGPWQVTAASKTAIVAAAIAAKADADARATKESNLEAILNTALNV